MKKVKNLDAAKKQAFLLVRKSPEYGRAIRTMSYHDRREFDKSIVEQIDQNAKENMSFIEKHPVATSALALLLVGGIGAGAVYGTYHVASGIADTTIDIIGSIPETISTITHDVDLDATADVGMVMIDALSGTGMW